MDKEIKEEKEEFGNKIDGIKIKLKENPWIASTAILGLVTLILVIMVLKPGLTGNVINGADAGNKLVEFANTQGIVLEVISVTDSGSFYEVEAKINGQQSSFPVTKDGKFLLSGVIPLTGNAVDNTNPDTGTETPTEVPKSDKPKVQAFIFSYCPYGLQFEKALLPAYDLLKNQADINIVAIGAMHGEYEKTESLRQISIEQLYSRDKLFAYLSEFDTNSNIGSCSGDATCLNKYLPAIYTKLGIDKAKVETYMTTQAETIYNTQGDEANSLGISGSPTFVINGVQSQVSRTPEAIKQAVCSAFNTAPSECSQTLSSSAISAGFGVSAGSASASAASCG